MAFYGPLKTYDSRFMENIEKYSIRNESAFTAYCVFPAFFLLHYHQGHSYENKTFSPRVTIFFNINMPLLLASHGLLVQP